jgi:hypothetical protein
MLLNRNAYYRVHKSPSLVSILSQTNPVHSTPLCFSKFHFNIILHLHLGFRSALFPSGYPPNPIWNTLLNDACYISCQSHPP